MSLFGAKTCSSADFALNLTLGFPAEHRLPGRRYLVKPRYARVPRRFDDELRILLGFFGNRFHRIDKLIELFLGLALGWLDHHRAMHHQRKADGVRMKAVIDQALGDVPRLHT